MACANAFHQRVSIIFVDSANRSIEERQVRSKTLNNFANMVTPTFALQSAFCSRLCEIQSVCLDLLRHCDPAMYAD